MTFLKGAMENELRIFRDNQQLVEDADTETITLPRRKRKKTRNAYHELDESTVKKNTPTCPVCLFDGGTVEASIAHIEEQIGAEDYQVPPVKQEKGGKLHCPICKKIFSNADRLRIHLTVHMVEAHDQQKECQSCSGRTFESM